jgi:hypothetical protein
VSDSGGWSLRAGDALDAARLREAFRLYLEEHGHPASDFHAAESAYGELVANCAQHAPGPLRVEFRWDDATLTVTDAHDRLRTWPFSSCDLTEETTLHRPRPPLARSRGRDARAGHPTGTAPDRLTGFTLRRTHGRVARESLEDRIAAIRRAR